MELESHFGELYPVSLDEWENLGKMAKNAVLCHVPVNRKKLTSEWRFKVKSVQKVQSDTRRKLYTEFIYVSAWPKVLLQYQVGPGK